MKGERNKVNIIYEPNSSMYDPRFHLGVSIINEHYKRPNLFFILEITQIQWLVERGLNKELKWGANVLKNKQRDSSRFYMFNLYFRSSCLAKDKVFMIIFFMRKTPDDSVGRRTKNDSLN